MSIDVKILGRLARDPELKSLSAGSNFAVFTFVTDSGAKDKDGKRKPIYVEITAWGKSADLIMQYCKKGSYLNITGAVYDESAFLGKDGNPKPKLSITLEKFEFVSGGAKSGGGNSNGNSNYSKPKQQAQQNNYLRGEPVDDMDIPF